MAKLPSFDEFRDETVCVPDFVPGYFGMDLTVRGSMTDKEWSRWVLLTRVPELHRMMAQYRKKNGIKGFRAAIMEFLTQQNITVV